MKSKAIGLVICLALLGASSAVATTYTIADTVGPWSVDGTITTNGDLGLLQTTDITAWNVTLTVTDPFFIGSGGAFTLGLDSTIYTDNLSTALSATPTVLRWDYSVVGENFLLLRGGGGFVKYSLGLFVVENGGDQFSKPYSGEQTIAAAASAVPLPGGVVLFATGLAGLGWLARRRRKQAA